MFWHMYGVLNEVYLQNFLHGRAKVREKNKEKEIILFSSLEEEISSINIQKLWEIKTIFTEYLEHKKLQ